MDDNPIRWTPRAYCIRNVLFLLALFPAFSVALSVVVWVLTLVLGLPQEPR